MHRTVLPRPATVCGLPAAHAYLGAAAATAAHLLSPWQCAVRAVAVVRTPAAVASIGAVRAYRDSRSKSSKPRNTFGSNEYRKKRALERNRRLGLVTPVDVPIQSVTDERWDHTTYTAEPVAKPVVGLDRNFPSFGRKYIPDGYAPPTLPSQPEAESTPSPDADRVPRPRPAKKKQPTSPKATAAAARPVRELTEEERLEALWADHDRELARERPPPVRLDLPTGETIQPRKTTPTPSQPNIPSAPAVAAPARPTPFTPPPSIQSAPAVEAPAPAEAVEATPVSTAVPWNERPPLQPESNSSDDPLSGEPDWFGDRLNVKPKFEKRMRMPDPRQDTGPLNQTNYSATTVPPPPASAAICCGCGAAFQSSFQDAPGFLPGDQLDKYKKRRMTLFEGRLEAERKKQEAAALREANARRIKNGEEPIIEAEVVEEGAYESHTSFSESTLHPDLHRRGKLDPSRPLAHQDLTLALNRGLVDTDSAEALLAQGIPPELIMTKRELNQVVREEREQVREQHGESALRCLRCFQLANYGYTRGQVASVRADDFRLLLRSRFMERGGRSSVILKVVDLFDFHGSFVRDFASIVGGRNPIILVANKYDLIPSGAGENRLRAWIKAEAERYGLHFHSIELVSALTGANLYNLMQSAKKLAEPDPVHDRPRRDIYIVGTTNVGKSSIVNKLIEKKLITSKGQFEATKIRPEAKDEMTDDATTPPADDSNSLYLSASSFMSPDSAAAAEAPELLHSSFNVLGGKMTASIVPGTTLGMVSFPFVQTYDETTGQAKNPIRHVLYDTPGVINPEQVSNILTFHELRECMPKRQIQPITFRVQRGQCLLLGGLARLDFVGGDRDYAFFTVFASRNVTVHITQVEKMDTMRTAADGTQKLGYLEFAEKHGGNKIYPPFTPQRCKEIGLHNGTRVSFDLHGRGWLEACSDVVFPGLGWVGITGSGQMTVRALLPGETRAYSREPLMPFESRKTMKKFTGSGARQH